MEQIPELTPPGSLEWNVVVTAREGMQRRLRRALRPVIRLRQSGFRNVFVGTTDDRDHFLHALADYRAQRQALDRWLGKVIPVRSTFRMDDPTRFETDLQAACAPVLAAVAGRSFHVRVERRGHKGAINTHTTERALGDHIYTQLAAQGAAPRVTFRDPDVIVVVEIIGQRCGVGLVTRADREQFPFVRID